jgi:hypothetical protein
LADAAEAELFATAFHRFVELHGRVVSDPMSRCRLTIIAGARGGAPRRLAMFWSRGAAREFDRFWASYRRVYGPSPEYATEPVS